MLKYLIGILVSLFVFSFVRAVWGVIQKALVEEVNAAVGGDGGTPGKTAPKAESTLRKCAACGTYKPEPGMIRYGSGAKSIFFCSAACEQKAGSEG